VMLALVGPALRAERNPISHATRGRRLLWLLTLAGSGAIVYLLLMFQ
jgi:hypothetical protein